MLDVRLDGEVIATIEEQALAVRIQTSRGETSATGLGPDDGVIDLIIDRVAPGGPPRLDQLEAAQMQALRDRSQEGQPVGYTRDFQVHPSGLSATQGVHNESLREGGVDRELTRRTRANGQVPSVDLGYGLLPGDVETRTARIEAFAGHGDAQRAINDYPAGGLVSTAPPVDDQTSGDDGDSSGPSGSSSEDPDAQGHEGIRTGGEGGIKLPGKATAKKS